MKKLLRVFFILSARTCSATFLLPFTFLFPLPLTFPPHFPPKSYVSSTPFFSCPISYKPSLPSPLQKTNLAVSCAPQSYLATSQRSKHCQIIANFANMRVA